MSDFDDENLEFDDDLPELDLSDLDSLEEESNKPVKQYEIKKYEGDPEDSEKFAELIKMEAIKALEVQDNGKNLPDTYTLDEEESGAEFYDYTEEDFEEEKGRKKGGLAIKIVIAVLILFIGVAAFFAFTPPGRNVLYKIAGTWVEDNVNKTINDPVDPKDAVPTGVDKDKRDTTATIIPLDPDAPTPAEDSPLRRTEYRSEDYVKTYLLFGIEEINGAANTDAILLLSINTKDNSIKLTSIMRDTFVEIPGFYGNKINSVYACGMRSGETVAEKKMAGGKLLMEVIEKTFDIEISGFACVNFKNFENIVNRLGGIDLELGSKEASYLCRTNYISNPSYRNVKAGWNHMNGNQVLGYCRVRKEVTLGGATNDYGRTLRHRRVINAIIQQYKSLPLGDMYAALKDCLAYVVTDLTEEDFTGILKDVVEHKTFNVNQMRLPIDGLFKDSGKKGKFNGKYKVTYAILIDGHWDETLKAFHEFVFLDSQNSESGEKTTSGSGSASGEPQLPTVTPTP